MQIKRGCKSRANHDLQSDLQSANHDLQVANQLQIRALDSIWAYILGIFGTIREYLGIFKQMWAYMGISGHL
jgi:hypothetical protein